MSNPQHTTAPDEAPTDGLDHDLPPDDELREAGQRQAWEEFRQTKGGPDSERAKRTHQTLEQKLRNVAQQYEQTVREVQQHRQKAANLDQTRQHLQDISEELPKRDRLVFRDWPGGITTEVKEDEIPDAINSVVSLHDQHETRAEEAAERAEQYAELREVLSYALEEARDLHQKAARTDEKTKETARTRDQDASVPGVQTLSGKRVEIGGNSDDTSDTDDRSE